MNKLRSQTEMLGTGKIRRVRNVKGLRNYSSAIKTYEFPKTLTLIYLGSRHYLRRKGARNRSLIS